MKRLYDLLRYSMVLTLFGIFASVNAQDSKHGIIPKPVNYEPGKGFFIISPATQIEIFPTSKELSKLSDFLSERLRLIQYHEKSVDKSSDKKKSVILLKISHTNELGDEGYKLVVDKKTITLTANTGKGIFYGIQTLFQLLPADIEDRNPAICYEKWKVPACRITDYPRFQYRGMHLDVCRHMFPVEFIKKYIDLMAMYKINNFHWHLTEDQGWRLEIKKYPLLTEIGSKRESSPVGRNTRDDNTPYGGYYTQAEARDIVEYAASRYVNIIPEIEMPGHALAALAAYPHLSCTGGPFEVWTKWGVTDDIYCAGKEEVFTFLEDVLTEVMSIFPSEYIHIGGDEAPKIKWDSCSMCRKRIEELGLKDTHELQGYFISRIEKFLNQNGRKIIGWDEIMDGGLAQGATVMSWRGIKGGIQAAKMSHKVIMTPGSPCYFDHYQGNPASEPLAFGGYNPLKSVYLFEPVPSELTDEESEYILGSQGNLWTEYIETPDHVEYMAYPRAIALAEVNWSAKSARNWTDFLSRFNKHIPRLEKRGVNFSRSVYNVTISTESDTLRNEMNVVLRSDVPGSKILYSINNGGNITPDRKYKRPFKPEGSFVINASVDMNNSAPGNITNRTIYVHEAFGKEPILNTPYSQQYKSKGALTLTDGCRAHPLALKNDWLGFQGDDADFLLDLGKETEIKNVSIGFLFSPVNWIFLPTEVNILLSTDGILFSPAEGMRPELLTIREPVTIDYTQVQINTPARYIRVVAKNRGICPDNHPGAGKKAWLFLDEVMVNLPGF